MYLFSRGLRKVLSNALILSAAVAAGTFDTCSQVNAEQMIVIGRNVLSMEDYMLAIQYFNQVIKAKPYMSDPYFYRGLAKLNLDDLQGAEEDCSEAIRKNKFKTEAYKLRGFTRMRLGQDSLAVIDFNEGLKTNPYDKYFLYYKGVALTSLKKYESADSVFNNLLKSHPSFDEGVAARGRLNLLRGDTVGALADADRAIRLNRTQISPWLMKAQIYADSKEWGQALENMDEAILLRPDEPDFYVNRAFLRYNSDDFFGAMADYNYALQLDPAYEAALFNRALLRLEVKDLARSAEDFSKVLDLDPKNFHALYNRGLVYLELGEHRKALEDFQAIEKRYPRFYPVYYAEAEAYRNLGNLKMTAESVNKADRMVANYVRDPRKNPLDRPAIAAGTTNRNGDPAHQEPQSEEEVMEQFNQLVTVSATIQPEMAFNDRIKGRVQDRNLAVDPAAPYIISIYPPEKSLKTDYDSFLELSQFNSRNYLPLPLYLVESEKSVSEENFEELNRKAEKLLERENESPLQAAEHFELGVIYTILKNYPAAIARFGMAVEKSPSFNLAYFGRAYALASRGISENSLALQMQALSDIDKVIAANPRNPYAWFNRAAIFYAQRDYLEAANSLDKAIEINPDFGPARFNRGLCRLQAGKKREAFADLSKAGELGVLPSYNLLKRMN